MNKHLFPLKCKESLLLGILVFFMLYLSEIKVLALEYETPTITGNVIPTEVHWNHETHEAMAYFETGHSSYAFQLFKDGKYYSFSTYSPEKIGMNSFYHKLEKIVQEQGIYSFRFIAFKTYPVPPIYFNEDGSLNESTTPKDTIDNLIGYSEMSDDFIVIGEKLGIPKNVHFQEEAIGLRVIWDSVEGAGSYEIEFSPKKGDYEIYGNLITSVENSVVITPKDINPYSYIEFLEGADYNIKVRVFIGWIYFDSSFIKLIDFAVSFLRKYFRETLMAMEKSIS